MLIYEIKISFILFVYLNFSCVSLTHYYKPYSDVVRLLEGLLTGLTDQEKDDIFYNNAKKFYNID